MKANNLNQLSPELRQVAEQLNSSVKQPTRSLSAIERAFIEFAIKNSLAINPAGYRKYADNYAKFGCCPCDSNRHSCPCPEALGEVAAQGHCLCHLFWKNYETFLAEKWPKEKEEK